MFLNNFNVKDLQQLIGKDGYVNDQGFKKRCKIEGVLLDGDKVNLILRDRSARKFKRDSWKFNLDKD